MSDDPIGRWKRLPEGERAARLARWRGLRGEGAVASGAVTPGPRDGPIPQSFAQQRLWFLHLLDPGDASYNMPECLRLRGWLDREVVRACLDELVRRHEALRTTFATSDGQPVQVIRDAVPQEVGLIDLAAYDGDAEAEARRLAGIESDRPFDLAIGPLVRLVLFRLGDDHHILLLNVHHIISDGWSTGIFVREFTELYRQHTCGEPVGLPPPALQFADYAIWERRNLLGAPLEHAVAYWKGRLEALPDQALPTDFARSAKPDVRGDFESLDLPEGLVLRIERLARDEGATLFMALLAAFKLLLRQATGREDLAVATPVANRNRPGLESIFGFFANTLVLRTDLGGDPTFREALRRVRDSVLAAFVHPEVPFDRLVEELRPARAAADRPLFRVMFILQNTPMPTMKVPGLEFEMLAAGTSSVKFDLLFELYKTPTGCRGWLGYQTSLFRAATVRRLMGRYEALLGAVADRPDVPGSAIALASPEEARSVVAGFVESLE